MSSPASPAAQEYLPAVRGTQSVVSAEDFMPLLSVEQAVARKSMINQFIGGVLREGNDGDGDYGTIPGTSKKKVLFKAGAEKLCSIFGMAPTYEPVQVIEDWTGDDHCGEPLFYYEYRCQLSRGGKFMGEAIGSSNSWESKHRYRWLRADQLIGIVADPEALPSRGGRQTLFAYEFAIDKAETTGQYGKPAEYWQAFKDAAEAGTARRVNKPFKNGKDGWGYEMDVDSKMYRIPNPDVADTVNTLQKIAQKRALVAVVLVVTNCSDAFTQDLEDLEPQQHTAPIPAARPQERIVPEALLDTFDAMKENPRVGMDMITNLEKWMIAKAGDVGKAAHTEKLAEYRTRIAKGKDTIGSVKELLLDLWGLYSNLLPPVAESEGGSI